MSSVPADVKRLIVGLHITKARLKEELCLLKKEMQNYFKFYRDGIIPTLETAIKEHEGCKYVSKIWQRLLEWLD